MKVLHYWLIFTLLCLLSLFAALWLRGGTDATPFALLESLVANIEKSFAEHQNNTPEPEENLNNNQPITQKHTQDSANPLPSHSTSTSSMDHTAEDRQVCSRPRTKSRNDTDSKLIYKWVDQEGQTHMSDTQPNGIIASVMDVGMTKRDFTYNIKADGVSVPMNFPGQLAAGSKRIYDTWHFFLGRHKLRQSRIEVLLIGGADRFNAYRSSASPNSQPVNGFYSMRKNEAVVKFDAARKEQALRTTFHEVSHLITASHLGPTPPWLTEGLAEYFETMVVKGQSGTIHPNQAHIELLEKTRLPRLQDYLAIDRAAWYGEQRHRNYAIAWSLMHFLLENSPGMYALQNVIQQAEENFCRPFSAADALDQAYPGGMQRLEQDWRKWLAGARHQIHQT